MSQGRGSAETDSVNACDDLPQESGLAGVKFVGRAARAVGKDRKVDSRYGTEGSRPAMLQFQWGYDRQVRILEFLQEAVLFQERVAGVTARAIELRNPAFSLFVLDRGHAIFEGVQEPDRGLTVDACLRESLEDTLRGQRVKVLSEFRHPGIGRAIVISRGTVVHLFSILRVHNREHGGDRCV
jgi:hypothetical protein